MGFHASVYGLGVDYISEIVYVFEMACCDECCMLGNSIVGRGCSYCNENGGVWFWSYLWT
jgi:hypothetical protein